MKTLSIALIVVCALAVGCGDKSPPPTSPTSTSQTPTSPVTPALAGLVSDSQTNLPLENARVEIVDPSSGSLTGNFVLTNASGRYIFPGISGSQSFRASKEGYEGQAQRIHLALTSNADFKLMPLHSLPPRETILPGDTKMGIVGGGDRTCSGLFFIRPCKRFILLVNEGAILNIGLTWQGTDDIDLELWRNDVLVDASLTCQACGLGTSQEEIARFISPGEYELRVVLWAGSGSSFTLTTRVN